jgi:hypothetical protein
MAWKENPKPQSWSTYMSYQYNANGIPETADRNMDQTKSVICDSDNEQSKVVPVPKHHNMKKYGGMAVNLIAFLILVLDGGEWSASSPVALIEQQAGNGPEAISKWGRKEKYTPLPGIKLLSSRT